MSRENRKKLELIKCKSSVNPAKNNFPTDGREVGRKGIEGMEKDTLLGVLRECLDLSRRQDAAYNLYVSLNADLQKGRVPPSRRFAKSHYFAVTFITFLVLILVVQAPPIKAGCVYLFYRLLLAASNFFMAIDPSGTYSGPSAFLANLGPYVLSFLVAFIGGGLIEKAAFLMRKEKIEREYENAIQLHQETLARTEPPLLAEISHWRQLYLEMEVRKNQLGASIGLHEDYQNTKCLNSLVYSLERGLCTTLQEALIRLDQLQRAELARNEERQHRRLIEAYTMETYYEALRASRAAESAATQAWLTRMDNVWK